MSDSLFITRKRKKWKFAHFDSWSNCFDVSHATPQNWEQYFAVKAPMVAEVGAGTADVSVGLAQAEPSCNYVALDIKSDRLYTGAKFAQEENLDNLAFVRANAGDLPKIFAPHSLSQIWLTFPDPYPRVKQAKHRLTHPTFLEHYAQLLQKDGVLRFKTDNKDLFTWSLEQLVGAGWQVTQLSFDLHDSQLPDVFKITTAYERKFMAQNITINYVAAVPKNPTK